MAKDDVAIEGREAKGHVVTFNTATATNIAKLRLHCRIKSIRSTQLRAQPEISQTVHN